MPRHRSGRGRSRERNTIPDYNTQDLRPDLSKDYNTQDLRPDVSQLQEEQEETRDLVTQALQERINKTKRRLIRKTTK